MWLPTGLAADVTIGVDAHGRICDPAGLPVEARRGLLVPGFVNAHTHLELAPVATAPGVGFVPWVQQMRAGAPPSAAQAGKGVYAAIRAGTAAIGEITNNGWSAGAIAAARLPARSFREVFGIDLDVPPALDGLTPHAPHSTHPNVIRAVAARGEPWSIHFDEDPEEAAWLATGTGAWRPFLERSGRDFGKFPIPGVSPAAYLAGLGVLDPRALLVHATCTRGADLDVIAASGARVCLCVRSNQHITGRLPDVPGLVERGVPLAIGTDSLASAPDLDPLAEAAALRRAFPELPAEGILRALTEGGADALDLPVGRLAAGLAPGLLLVEIPATADPLALLFDGTPWRRRWLACPAA